VIKKYVTEVFHHKSLVLQSSDQSSSGEMALKTTVALATESSVHVWSRTMVVEVHILLVLKLKHEST